VRRPLLAPLNCGGRRVQNPNFVIIIIIIIIVTPVFDRGAGGVLTSRSGPAGSRVALRLDLSRGVAPLFDAALRLDVLRVGLGTLRLEYPRVRAVRRILSHRALRSA
jgi:hypothetical protein